MSDGVVLLPLLCAVNPKANEMMRGNAVKDSFIHNGKITLMGSDLNA